MFFLNPKKSLFTFIMSLTSFLKNLGCCYLLIITPIASQGQNLTINETLTYLSELATNEGRFGDSFTFQRQGENLIVKENGYARMLKRHCSSEARYSVLKIKSYETEHFIDSDNDSTHTVRINFMGRDCILNSECIPSTNGPTSPKIFWFRNRDSCRRFIKAHKYLVKLISDVQRSKSDPFD